LDAGGAKEAVEIPDDDDDDAEISILQEDDDGLINLDDIPELDTADQDEENERDDDELFVQDSEDSEPVFQSRRSTDLTRHQNASEHKETEASKAAISEDKKKLGLRTYYDGFSIYGRILCLVIRRRGGRASSMAASSQQLMENWVSTQAAAEGIVEDD